jgi:hypothetical protein
MIGADVALHQEIPRGNSGILYPITPVAAPRMTRANTALHHYARRT